jgi:hypothetical protein
VFVSAAITIAKEIGFLFQVEDCGSKAPAFFARKFRKFSENFGRAHQPSLIVLELISNPFGSSDLPPGRRPLLAGGCLPFPTPAGVVAGVIFQSVVR